MPGDEDEMRSWTADRAGSKYALPKKLHGQARRGRLTAALPLAASQC